MKKLVNLFLVDTEYHLLISAVIILEHYSNNEKYHNIISFDLSNKRFAKEYNETAITAEFVPYESAISNKKKCYNGILKLTPDRFFFFQEGSAINIFLANRFKKKNTIVCLAQDGTKPYAIVNKRHEFLSTIKDSINAYITLYRSGLFLRPTTRFRLYKYGSTPFISELWLTHPHSFVNNYDKIIRKIPELSESRYQPAFGKLFNFNINSIVFPAFNIILYINQPINDTEIIKEEIKILKSISGLYPEKTFVCKLHPLTTSAASDLYIRELNGIIYRASIPVELLIMQLKNSIILSGWSTALLTNNPSCRFYYFYPMLPTNKIMEQIKPVNPTNHIVLLQNTHDLKNL